MSETDTETEEKTARGGQKMTLNVRRTVESGHVRQSFSHGRSKSVVVEKKKRRVIGGADQPLEEPKQPPKLQRAAVAEVKPKQEEPQRRTGVVLKQLSDEEKDLRTRALVEARQRQAEEERLKSEQPVVTELVPEVPPVAEEPVEVVKSREERHKGEAKAKEKAEEAPPRKHLKEEEEPARSPDLRHKKSPVAPRRGQERVRGRLTIINALDEEQRQRSLASLKRRQERHKKQVSGPLAQQKIQREVVIPEVITIQELANRMAASTSSSS